VPEPEFFMGYNVYVTCGVGDASNPERVKSSSTLQAKPKY